MIAKLLILCSIILLTPLLSLGQKDWVKILKDNITPKVFTEAYFATNALNIESNERPEYFYNHKRLNEIGLNSAIIGFDFDYRSVRSSISFIAGNYATYNIKEPPGLKHIYEANFGVKLLKHHDLWLDVGVMESNLGFESVVSSANRTMTRSLMAESSPYYLNAAKLNYTSHNEKWLFELIFSNGWQKMTAGRPTFGHTIQFHPKEKWTINSSSFIGQVRKPDGNFFYYYNRFFHNFYIQREAEITQFTIGVDYGMDRQNPTLPPETWNAYIAQFTYNFNDKISSTLRGEYFNNIRIAQIIQNTNVATPGSIWGASINLDIQLHKLVKLRLETRYAQNQITYNFFPGPYPNYTGPQNSIYLGTSLSIDLWNH